MLDESLNKVRAYVDEDGKLHFVDSEGADTVLPFSGGWEDAVLVQSYSSPITIDIGRKPKELIVGISASNATTSTFNLLFYYNEEFSDYVFGDTITTEVTDRGATLTDTGFTVYSSYNGRPVFYAYK